MEVAVDISKCAVRDMDVDIGRWAGMQHDCASDRGSAIAQAVVKFRSTIKSESSATPSRG